MLLTLRIRNLALVTDLTLELQPGYNVITGETGAGKSIIIGALNLVLGERADRTLIRDGSDSCSVEAVFDMSQSGSPPHPALSPDGGEGIRRTGEGVAPSKVLPGGKGRLNSFLEENGLEPCEDNHLVLKRTFTVAGANRQFINGSPTTLAALASIGEWLVDIHGPHDHQSLLHSSKQLAILDAFGGLGTERGKFGELVHNLDALEREKAALIVDEKTYAQQLDLLRFQVKEISEAQLQAGEDAQLEQDYQRASNAAKLLQLSQAALDLLSDNEASLLTQAGAIGRTLQELRRVDAGAEELVQLHEQTVASLRELQSALSHYADKVDVDPQRLQQLEERLNLIQSLKRKYGGSVADILVFGDEARRKLESLEERDAELSRINAEIQKVEENLLCAGRELSAKRRKVIPRLSKAVSQQLGDLGFAQSRFDVSLTSSEHPLTPSLSPNGGEGVRRTGEGVLGNKESSFNSAGFDQIEFQFAPNPGEASRPLRAIASSGEMARVMLAIKTVLAAEDEIPVLIFDEVDANIGGETANVVGEKMRQLAKRRQVLCITHLPQVAAPASAHYVVTKQVKGGRTVSEINLINGKERVTELARMLGGQTDAARKHAEAMLK